jgi:hypothetical protein
MTTPVSFPLAKLLKEKGFDKKCKEYFTDGTLSISDEPKEVFIEAVKTNKIISCKAPTISDVVMWIYEKHKIWISVDPENDINNTWFHTISHGKSTNVFGNYSSLTEAYEAGIEDVLINMI